MLIPLQDQGENQKCKDKSEPGNRTRMKTLQSNFKEDRKKAPKQSSGN
jgi:hypothetical protein